MEKAALQYKGYCGTSEISYEDNILHGKVLFINDLITYEGETPSELKSAFESAIADYEAQCKAQGTSPNKPCSGTFNVRTTPELHRAASMKAALMDTTLNELVNRAISDFLNEKKIEIHNHKHEHHHGRAAVSLAYAAEYQLFEEAESGKWQAQESRRQPSHH
ncbi:type II toxin-antitoxin system HicB family antitoxin [Cupriavidus basilensis]